MKVGDTVYSVYSDLSGEILTVYSLPNEIQDYYEVKWDNNVVAIVPREELLEGIEVQ